MLLDFVLGCCFVGRLKLLDVKILEIYVKHFYKNLFCVFIIIEKFYLNIYIYVFKFLLSFIVSKRFYNFI